MSFETPVRPVEQPASMARRMLLVTGLGSLLMALAVAIAASLAVDEEVNELLDDSLQASALQLAPLLHEQLHDSPPGALPALGSERFAWAWYDSAQRLVRASPGADPEWLQRPPQAGLWSSTHWRLHDHLLGEQGWLRVAQSRAERQEASAEVAEFALLAGLGVALIGLPLLAWRAHQELRPLRRLAHLLENFDAASADPRELAAALGSASRAELLPVQRALATISERLGERLAFEREFGAQAAHLLRTPLAGMDAQLAVALKENPGQPRLQRVREASQRLQAMVLALLRLFRSEPQVQRTTLDARALLAGLPLGELQLQPGPPCPLQADAELLAAALLNLVDNAQRHGATRLWLGQETAQSLRLRDDGSGVDAAQREALRQRLQAGAAEPGGAAGLGLRLARRVALAHGGSLNLPDTEQGFEVELHL
jgi:signal transduction histidine kinase